MFVHLGSAHRQGGLPDHFPYVQLSHGVYLISIFDETFQDSLRNRTLDLQDAGETPTNHSMNMEILLGRTHIVFPVQHGGVVIGAWCGIYHNSES